jgi:hypothetical protein
MISSKEDILAASLACSDFGTGTGGRRFGDAAATVVAFCVGNVTTTAAVAVELFIGLSVPTGAVVGVGMALGNGVVLLTRGRGKADRKAAGAGDVARGGCGKAAGLEDSLMLDEVSGATGADLLGIVVAVAVCGSVAVAGT